MFELTVHDEFSAAHRLRGYEGKCERLHGHNYKVCVVLRADELDDIGMVVDFKQVKAALDEALQQLDHTLLNDTEPFRETNPTAENIAKWIAEELGRQLPAQAAVRSVTTFESDRCGATYFPETEE
jgi:6-pyruvoyltetrahydropterin/6-carboxytetrahydropterin synthase